ncbi:MAG: magnesium chelatase, partial [Acidimicrobiales bacterium]
IITPLKDRFGAQIRTHYPLDTELELAVVRQEARPLDAAALEIPDLRVEVPEYMAEIVATVTHEARRSPHVNQRSGVSVRLTIANYETMVANATRRALRLGEPEAVPRISDLAALASSTAGKVEIEAFEEGRAEATLDRMVAGAVLSVFKERVPAGRFGDAIAEFDTGTVVHTGDDIASGDYMKMLAGLPALRGAVLPLVDSETPAAVASATEWVLEGLHLSRRLNKDSAGAQATYRGR